LLSSPATISLSATIISLHPHDLIIFNCLQIIDGFSVLNVLSINL